jgi:hypothetical protein
VDAKAGIATVKGDLRAMTLTAPAEAETLRVNGQTVKVEDGVVRWTSAE